MESKSVHEMIAVSMQRKHELDLDLRGSSWSYTKMRFVKPALRWIHVYQLWFKNDVE